MMLFAALPCFAAFASGRSPDLERGERLSLVDGYIVVDVRINHRGPFRMVVDTGSTSSALTDEAARAAGLEPDERVILSNAAGERLVAGTRAAHMSLGPVVAEGVEVLFGPFDALHGLDRKVDGLLGQNFLGRFGYLIDYRRRRLWLGSDADRQGAGLEYAVAIEMAYGRLLLPVVLTPGSRLLRMALDSGAANLVIACGSGCAALAAGQDEGRLRTNTRDQSVRKSTLTKVRVGSLTFGRAAALLLGQTPRPGQGDGLLPARWFSAVYVGRGSDEVRFSR